MLILIGFFHLFLAFFIIFYSIIASKKYDKYLLVFILITSSHWVFLDGECIISYIYKKLKYKNYKLAETTHCDDIEDTHLFFKEKFDINTKYDFFGIAYVLFFIRVFLLQSLKPIYIILSTLYFYFIWNYVIKIHNNKKERKPISNLIKVFILILILILINIILQKE